MTLTVSKSIGQVFYGISLNYDQLDFSPNYTGVMSLREEGHREKVPFSSCNIKSKCYPHNITVGIDLDHLAKVMFVRVHHCTVSLSLLFLYLTLWKSLSRDHTKGPNSFLYLFYDIL